MSDFIPLKTDLLDSDSDKMDSYWKQCQVFDSRPFDTLSIMSSSVNQVDSQQAFAKLLAQINERR